MAQAVGDVVVALRADISPFQQGMQQATRSMRTVEQRGQAMGSALSGAAGNVATLTTSLTRAKGQMTAVQARINNLVGVTDRLSGSARASADAFRQFDQARAQVDALRSSYDPMFAASKRYEAAVDQLNNALSLGVIKQQEYETALEQLGRSYLTAEGQAQAFGRSMRASTAHTTNLMFQFQDIGMMLAAGQSPLMLAMQQGTQVSGIFQQMRNSGQSAFQGIIGGLGAMINPMSLLTIGTIAGGAALAQWGMSALGARDGANSLEDSMGALNAAFNTFEQNADIAQTSIVELYRQFGAFAEQIQQTARLMTTLGLDAAMDETRNAIVAVRAPLDNINTLFRQLGEAQDYLARQPGIGATSQQIFDAQQNVQDLTDELESAADALGMSVTQARLMSAQFDRLQAANGPAEVAEAAAAILRHFERIRAQTGELPAEFRVIAENLSEVQQRAASAANVLNIMSDTDLSSLTAQAAALAEQLGISADEALRLLRNMSGAGAGRGSWGMPTGDPIFDTTPEDLPPGGSGGGGGGGRDFAAEFEALQTQLMTETERVQLEYETRLENLREFRAQRVATEEEFNELERRINADHANQMRDLELQGQNARLSVVSGMMGDLATILEAGGNRNLEIVRGFKIAEALISGYQAAVDAWQQGMRQGGPAVAALYTAGSLAKTGALIAQMKSSSRGGGVAAGGGAVAANSTAAPQVSRNVTIQLTGGNMFSREQVIEIISGINEAVEDGAIVRVV